MKLALEHDHTHPCHPIPCEEFEVGIEKCTPDANGPSGSELSGLFVTQSELTLESENRKSGRTIGESKQEM
jgi:hypothetical protein